MNLMRNQGRTPGSSFLNWLGESYSVHVYRSDRVVLGFRFSNRLFLFFCLVAVLIFSRAVLFSFHETNSLNTLNTSSDKLQANLTLLEDDINVLEKAYTNFQKEVNAAFSEMPVTHGREYVANLDSDTDLGGRSLESRLAVMNSGVQTAMDYLDEFRTMMRTRQAILQYIPNRWPVSGGEKFLTMEFGPNIHPIGKYWYLHKGVDLAGPTSLMVVASATGRVTKIGYAGDSEYGNYVEVEHRFGFKTKYAHLGRVFIREGQDITAGEAIGTMGNTGKSTGPHLHFEIVLGTQVIDPASFLKISNTFERWKGDRGGKD